MCNTEKDGKHMKLRCDCTNEACGCQSSAPRPIDKAERTDCPSATGAKCVSRKSVAEVSPGSKYAFIGDSSPCFKDAGIYNGWPSCIIGKEGDALKAGVCNCQNASCGCVREYAPECMKTVSITTIHDV